MERYGIHWLQKGTHEKHLSVLDYEKKVRAEEVTLLETQIDDLHDTVKDTQKTADETQAKLDRLQDREYLINLNVGKYDNEPEWQLPEPTKLMTAKTYKTKIVEPFIKKLKGVISSLVSQYLELAKTVEDLRGRYYRTHEANERLMDRITEEERANKKLSGIAKDYKLVRSALGEEKNRCNFSCKNKEAVT